VRNKRLIDIIAPNAKNISLCIVLSLILWYDIFIPQTGDLVVGNTSNPVVSPLTILIEGIISPAGFMGKITGLFLYLLLFFAIIRINDIYSFIRVRTILPSLFCLITGGILLRPHIFSSGIIVALLVFSAFYFSFKLLTEEKPKYAFNVSLMLFMAALFSFSCVWLLIVFWIFAYSSNVLSFRVFLASLLGVFTLALYAAIGFWITECEHLLLEYIQNSFKFFAVDFNFSLSEIIYLSFIGFLILSSLINYTVTRSQENIRPRKEFSYIIHIFISILILVILSVPDSDMLLWLLIPFGSFLLGRFFSLNNSRFTKTVLYIYFGSSLLLLLFN